MSLIWLRITDRIPAAVQKASGASAVLLGLAVIVGWQTGNMTLVQGQPGLVATPYVTALAFVIAGVGLLCAATSHDEIAGIAGLVIACIGPLTLAQDFLSVNPHTDLVFGGTLFLRPTGSLPARMPPNAALCFALVGAGLFLRRAGSARTSMLTSLFGALTAALGVAAVVGYASQLPPAYGWGRFTELSLPAAMGFMLLGVGLVALGWQDSPVSGGALRRPPALVAVASLTVTIVVWHALVVHDREQSYQVIEMRASYLRAAIAESIEGQVRNLERLAERSAAWRSGRQDWEAMAEEHVHDFDSAYVVERIDPGSGERWQVPNRDDAIPPPLEAEDGALLSAIARHSTFVGRTIDLAGGAKGFIVTTPMFRDGTAVGELVAVIRFDKLLQDAVAGQGDLDYETELLDGAGRVGGKAGAALVSDEWMAETKLSVRGAPFTLRVWPTPALLARLEDRMSSLILAGGLLLSAGLTSMTFFAGMSRRRELQLREAASRLRESEERYRSLIDCATDMIYRVDTDGHFTFVNPVTTRVMKRTQEDLIGLHFLELVSPAWRDEAARFYARQVSDRMPHTYFEFLSVDGDTGPLWIGQNVQLLLQSNTVIGLQAVARDITERKRAEAVIAEARDAALESDRLKSEFVAKVSHELRTPMNGILGLADLLFDTDLTPEQRDRLVTLRDCGQTLLTLMNDILDMSKVAAGKLELHPTTFELRQLVQQTTDVFAQQARHKGIDLVCLVQQDVPKSVTGDPSRLRQVLTNLLGNAVKFTDCGEIVVKVAVAGTLQDAVTLRIEVTDTGIGISPEAAAGLFQPFAQADGSITRKYGGTGLGLVISRQLAELMGGEMGMTSEVGRGSTFWFTLRVTPVQSAGQVSRRSKGNLEGVSALVVQASDSGRERLCDVLATRQVRVTGESTVEGALRRLEVAAQVGNPFDIVVVDLRSHEISVLDFAAAANDLGLMSRSRVILISGPGLPGDAQRLQQLGAAAYLTSPITNADLFDCFEMVMGSEPAHVSSTSDSAGLITRHTLKEDRFNANPVLLVEDNSVNQKVMVGFLTKLGYRTDVATNGREALEALSRTAYRLVLMDSQMPELDGFATTTEIRRREQNTRHTIVVAVTAHAMKGERERCLAAGMDDYLSKPVSLERLADVMERWLSSPVDGSPESVPRTAQSHLAEEAVPTVDATVLAHLRELEADVPGLLQDVLSTFLRETPVRLAKLAGAISTEDHAAVQAVAHSLKGSAGSIGAQRMLELCTRLEGSGGESLARCGPILEALGDEFRLLRDWLDREHVNPDLLDEATGEIVVHDES